MSTQVIKLDRERKLVYDWDALLMLEHAFGVRGIAAIATQAADAGFEQLLHFIRAGLSHEEKNISFDRVKALVAKAYSIAEAGPVLWAIITAALIEDLGLKKAGEEDEKNATSPDQAAN